MIELYGQVDTIVGQTGLNKNYINCQMQCLYDYTIYGTANWEVRQNQADLVF